MLFCMWSLLSPKEKLSGSFRKPHNPKAAVYFPKSCFRSCELTSDINQLSQNATGQWGLHACHWFSSLQALTINAVPANLMFLLDHLSFFTWDPEHINLDTHRNHCVPNSGSLNTAPTNDSSESFNILYLNKNILCPSFTWITMHSEEQ